MTKESVNIRKELNSHWIGLAQKHAKESVCTRKELNSHRIGTHDKRKCLYKKRVELSQDWFGTTT